MLTEALASAFARVALANGEHQRPLAVSHLHWLLARVLRLYPMLGENGRIAAALDAHLCAANLEAELDYLKKNPLFERPYGWAWLLELQAEALRMNARWARALAPLAEHLAAKMADFVSLPYPMRSGAHFNTAFACILALDYARVARDLPLQFAIQKAAKRWYGSDRDAPLAYEPSLDDFLSPSLVEAVLMKQVLEPVEFARWLNGFLPDGIGPLAEPPLVADRSDAKQSHLDGLCLSRAWCLNALGLKEAGEANLAAGLPQVVGGDYVGEHWLASFAVLALSGAALKTP